jgi:hypothetical protein
MGPARQNVALKLPTVLAIHFPNVGFAVDNNIQYYNKYNNK